MTEPSSSEVPLSRREAAGARPRVFRGLPRPPGPRGWPKVGVAVSFQRDLLQMMTTNAQRYGDVVYVDLAGTDAYVFSHPEDIQAVLVGAHADVMKDDPTHALSRFLGRGLVTSEGRFWRRQRKIAAPSFARHRIGAFAGAMVDATHNRLGRFAEGGIVDVHADMMVITLEIVLRTMFGEETIPGIDAVGELVETMTTGFARTYLTWRRLVPAFLRASEEAELDDVRGRLDAIIYGLIDARRRSRRPGGDDLLAHLLDARDDQGHPMTDEQLRDEVATIFLAGHETTALTLSYALWLLARAPEIQDRLRAEVDETIGRRRATLDDVPRLPFCDAVVKEAMRLYPPVYLVGREALRDIEIAGWTVPRGAQVLTPQWVVHRDARWYDAPLDFRPERWLDGLPKRLHRFAYFPFGGGARVCVGNHFAMLEAILVLATLVQHLEVAPDPDHRLTLAPTVTLRPQDGVRVRVTPRGPRRIRPG